MSEEKIMNRWIVVIGAILIQLALGTIYTWGTMTIFLTPYLNSLTPETIDGTITVYIFGFGLLSFAITMIFSGQLQQKIGPKKTAMIGGIILGIGVISSAAMTSPIGLLITYGILFGAGISFGYVSPIACAAKWFPDKKGLINGLAVAGFGAGAFIFNYVIKWLVNPTNLEVNDPNFISEVTKNVPLMFIVIGIIYVVLVIGGALTLNNPPEGWRPEGWTPPIPMQSIVISGVDYNRNELIKLPQFWHLWAMFVLSAISGLMVIGSYASFAKSLDDSKNFIYVIGASNFVLIGSLAALFNGAGRIFWGKLADVITYQKAMVLIFSIQAALMLLYFTSNVDVIYFTVMTCALFFCFGGNFSLFPTATTDLFGSKNLGSNYGILFTAYGIAGFMGATMVNTFVTLFGGYLILFVVMGIMSIGSAVLSFYIKAPKQSGINPYAERQK